MDIKSILSEVMNELDEAVRLALLTAKENGTLRKDDLNKIHALSVKASSTVVHECDEGRDEISIATMLATARLLVDTVKIFIEDNSIDIVEDDKQDTANAPEHMYL